LGTHTVTAGALAFDPWAALRADHLQSAGSAAPSPPRAPKPACDGVPHLGGLGGLGVDEISGGNCACGSLDHDEAEAAALAAHYAARPSADPWQPGNQDPLGEGLLAAALARPRSLVKAP
jgi:hypothetical protein